VSATDESAAVSGKTPKRIATAAAAAAPKTIARMSDVVAIARLSLGSLPAKLAAACVTPSSATFDISIAMVVRKATSPRPDGPRARDTIRTLPSDTRRSGCGSVDFLRGMFNQD
jgi:hypothetical protein